MKAPDRNEPSPWRDALLAARLFAVDPEGTGGVMLRASPGLARERWLQALRALLPAAAPMRKLPLHAADSRLLGGLDLAATLRAGRPIAERGILAEADGGVLVVAMAERVSAGTAARLAAVLDVGAVRVERDGLAIDAPARIGVVALDEGLTEEERPPTALADRFAFRLDLAVANPDGEERLADAAWTLSARARLADVTVGEETVKGLCAAAMALGIASIRAPLLALKVARAHAALCGRDEASAEDAAVAGRLVLAPRATVIPLPEQPPDEQPPPDNPEPPTQSADDERAAAEDDRPLRDVVLDAAKAAIPPGLLDQLLLAGGPKPRKASAGRVGQVQKSKLRGRPAGVRRGEPRAGARLNVVETLRAAAPWQPLRRRERERIAGAERAARVEVRRDDFRITKFKQHAETTTIFVVDASGSAALHRLAEAKGAVELLLADCYVRRDQVALVAFRGRAAELLLPPTRSLVRAKRNLAGLPGGGGTPLAMGIELAAALADQVRRRGQTPIAIFLTDGQANIARDGSPGRAKAEEDARTAARALRAAGFTAMMIDISPHPRPAARALAAELGGTYLPLPYADASTIATAVRAETRAREGAAPPG